MSRTSTEPHAGKARPTTWGRKDEEYIADFTLVAKRTLTDAEYKLFRYHYMLGADWRLCSRKLHIDRGNFFHSIYRIEQKLGRRFRELEPYALFPLDDYFHGPSRLGMERPRRNPSTERSQNVPQHLRFPPIGRAA